MYLFFSRSTLWKTDGTEAGTTAVREIGFGYSSASTVANNCVFFIGYSDDYSYRTALWKSDGTALGTQILFRFGTSIRTDHIKDLQTIGDKVIFTVLDESTGYRTIWISDGTEAGTLPLRNNLDGKLILDHDAQFTLYNDGIAFQAATAEVGYELFRIDTTHPVSPPANMTVTGNSVQKEIFWPDVPGAIQYDVWLQSLTDRSLPVTRFRANDPHIAVGSGLPTGTYRVWVRSMPVLGEPSPWSLPKDFIMAAVPEMSPPGLYTTSTPVLHWTGSSNTATYQVWITNRDTKTVSLYATEITATSFVVAEPLAPGNYAVWVRGKLADRSLTSWSAVQEFNVLAPAVQLTSGTGELKTSRPTLTWPAVNGATGYNIDVYSVGTSQFIPRLVYSLKNFQGLSATPPSDFPAGKFRVYVTAWKGPRLLTQVGGGDLLWVQLPPTGLRSTATGLAWDAAPFAGSYTFELRGMNGALYVPRKTQTGTTIDFTNLLPPGKYSLRVFANYPKASSNWSETFSTELFHPPVTITSSSAATVDATPTISWTAAPGASTYEVVVTRPGSVVPVYDRIGIKGTSHRIDVPLTMGVSQIQVRAIYPDESRSSLSAVQSLQTGIGTALKYENRTLSWNAANAATNYELWLNYLSTPNQRKIVYQPMYLYTAYTLPSTLPKGRYQTWLRPVRAESGQLYYGAWTNVIFDIE
jgi:hypothetical protein